MEKFIKIICTIAVTSAVIAITVFISHFGFGFASNIGNWGAIGDFFGGVLNPMFALFSLILIAHTLMQNKQALEQSEKAIEQGTKAIEQNEKALQVSNKELELTRNELANSSKALEEQASLLAVQSFETTFFNMLALHDKVLKNIKFNSQESYSTFFRSFEGASNPSIKNEVKSGTDAIDSISQLIGSLVNKGRFKKSAVEVFDVIFDYENKLFGSYFRNLYQILLFISNSTFDDKTKNKYSNILRAQLSNQELSLLMLNALSTKVDKGQFRKLLIEFSILEHLNLNHYVDDLSNYIFTIQNPNIPIETKHLDKFIKLDQNNKVIKSAFGSNLHIASYLSKLSC